MTAERLADDVIDFILAVLQNSEITPQARAHVAALLRPHMGAERCELCQSGDIPIGHFYHFTDEGRESCKNCRCVECLPSAPDAEEKA